MSETRKIAAILVSDIVGFSRLAGADEDRLLARLRALRSDLIDPIIAVHRGRVVKRTGDGALVEFRSVVDAVRCALEVQNGMIERNAGLPPDRRIEFRIGIHLGDVVEEADGDLMGDGVNIAARLEGIAQPGAICLSEDAYRQVSNRLSMTVADLGPTQLKNIERPIRVYSMQVGEPAQVKDPKPAPVAPKRTPWPALAAAALALAVLVFGAARWLRPEAPSELSRPAVAVLPFESLGGDEDANRLADGMTVDVITNLGRFKDVLVIGRNSVLSYKGKPVDARQVGRDLNVNYVLSGSIQHAGERLRVSAQLIDAANGAETWSERWDRPSADLFTVQAEVADKIARTLAGREGGNLGPIKEKVLADAKRRPATNLTAYELVLMARDQEILGTKESIAKGFEYVNKAIEIDPNLAHAYAIRGWLRTNADPWPVWAKPFESDMRKALAIDPNHYSAQAGMIWYFAFAAKWDELSAAIETAMRDNPNNNVVLRISAANLPYLGRPDESVKVAETVLRLDPHMPRTWMHNLMPPFFFTKNFERVLPIYDQVPEVNRGWWERLIYAASLAFLGRDEEAQKAKADLIAKNGEQVQEIWYNYGEVFFRAKEQDLLREAFIKLGFRICATPEELKKFEDPKRLPECLKK